jgi:glycosyltransferase involved in cell wall biosynthesis
MLTRILLTTDAVGGVWRYSMELARGLSARRAEVILAVLGPAPTVSQHREAVAVPGLQLIVTDFALDWLTETPDQLEDTAWSLANLAREVRAETIQVHAPALVGKVAWPVPVVAVVHSCIATWWRAVWAAPLPSDLAWQAAATAVGIERADHVVAPSRSFAEALYECYGTIRPIEIILNGREPLRTHCPARGRVLTAGRLWDEGKNIKTLDAAAARLNWPVYAAGPLVGPNGAQSAGSHLQVLGPLAENALAEEYAGAAVFVSMALYEPFGLAVLEAAQAGCALILSDIPTFRELWDGAAVFVPPRDSDRLAEEIQNLRRDQAFCSRMGEAARRRSDSFSSRHMVDAIWDIHAGAAACAQFAA